MFALKNRKGFTIIELFIVIIILAIVAVIIGFFVAAATIVVPGNCWYAPSSLLRELQVTHPEVQEIVRTETHLIDPSIIVVKNQDGSNSSYLLDSDILFNYDLTKVNKGDTLEKATLKNE